MLERFRFTIEVIHKALMQCSGNQTKAASLLGIDRSQLSRFKRGSGKAAWIGVPDPKEIEAHDFITKYRFLIKQPISRNELILKLGIGKVTLYRLIKKHGLILPPKPKQPRVGALPKEKPLRTHKVLTNQKIIEALSSTNGNRSEAAIQLGVNRATLYRFMEGKKWPGLPQTT